MSAAYIIHQDEDRDFLAESVLPLLPALGIDRWLSRAQVASLKSEDARASLVAKCVVALAIVGDSAEKNRIDNDISLVDRSGIPLVIIWSRVQPPETPKWGARPDVIRPAETDTASREQFWKSLVPLLPRVPSSAPIAEDVAKVSETIPWNAELFSLLLRDAADRRDYFGASVFVARLERQCRIKGKPYPETAARNDLSALRGARFFVLMRRSAQAVIAAGTADFQVRRQLGQALIELGEFEEARRVLNEIVRVAPTDHKERFEARGLLGRANKQQYVNAPQASDAGKLLANAIDEYWSVFKERQDLYTLWHACNAASCIRRCERDGRDGPGADASRELAAQSLAILTTEEEKRTTSTKKGRLDVWDCAVRVEALVLLDRFEEANSALDDYLSHPGMKAFEVSATLRQFDEVLELGKESRAQPIVDRLWKAVERHRTIGIAMSDKGSASMLVEAAHPDWEPRNVPELTVHAKMGTVWSVSGTHTTIRALLKDPQVVMLEGSRPSGPRDCGDSVPAIGVAESYMWSGGTYSEKGKNALIAIIDDGIDVLHRAFLDAGGNSRIVGIWDQTDYTGPPPAGFAFGTYHDAGMVAGYVANPATVPPPLRNPDGHGTHVASIAAGRTAGAFAGGVASEASLLAVISGRDEPTGYSQAHLAALQFIDKMASTLGKPVVVNVSQGMNAGAHDGRSPLEKAFNKFCLDDLGDDKPGRVIVKSAGNEHNQGGHARITLKDGVANLPWSCQLDPLSRHIERIELWWRSDSSYKFRLRSPGNELSAWIHDALPDPEIKGRMKPGGPYTLRLVKNHPTNGKSLLEIQIGSGVGAIVTGTWVLEIETVEVVGDGLIDAWIERGARYPSAFTDYTHPDTTLSIPGTSDNVIAVGSVSSKEPLGDYDYSSQGPTADGRPKPDVCAPGIKILAAKAGTADDVIPLSGTSMAAPHVTGAVALALSKRAGAGQPWPTVAQVASQLRQTTRKYDGVWNNRRGFGRINVPAFLAKF